MAKVAIGFSWQRDLTGYRLVGPDVTNNEIALAGKTMNTRRRQSQRIVPNVPNGGRIERYEPLERFPRLFTYFASIPKTPEGLLDFVNKYGPLTYRTRATPELGGDVVEYFLDMARVMEQMLSSPTLNKDMSIASVTAKLSPDPISGSVRLKLEVDNLEGALWLQCAQHLSSGASLRCCQQCNTWFE